MTVGSAAGTDPVDPDRPAGRPRSRLVRWLLGERAPATVPEIVFPTPDVDLMGVSCSGGGIRSASYNLGALQALQQAGELDKAGYVAAVSGGSYIAGAHAIARHGLEQQQADPALVTRPAFAPGSAEERYLRNHSHYIAPDLQTTVTLVTRLLLGVAINVAIVWMLLNVAARPLGWLYATQLAPGLRASGRLASLPYWVGWVLAPPAAVGVLFLVVDGVFRPGTTAMRQWLRTWTVRLLLLTLVLAAGLVVLPLLLQELRAELAGQGVLHRLAAWLPTVNAKTGKSLLSQLIGVLSAVGLWGVLLGALRAALRREESKLVTLAAALVAPLVVAGTFLVLLNDAASAGPKSTELVWFGATVLGLTLIEVFGDLTNWSMHPFYKRQLSSVFALRRLRDPAGAVAAEEIPYATRLGFADWVSKQPPRLVVCAAANVSDPGLTPPGRNALSFTFTADAIGDPYATPLPTATLEELFGKRARDLTLPTAIAISGAAVSPSMGKMTRRSYRFLLGLANVRLGVWLPNPRWVQDWTGRLPLPFHPRPHYLLWELLGINHAKRRFLYVTDGGHYENLGLVELLRRGCTTIYCFDAAGDKGTTFATLGQAVEIARADLGVEVTIDPQPLKLDSTNGLCGTDHAIGHIRYPATPTTPEVTGHLVYAKAAVTAHAPWDVLAYARHDQAFPYTSTLYQRFNEQQFEAYRALGAHTGPRAVTSLQDHLRTCALVPAQVPVPLPAGIPPISEPTSTPVVDPTADVRILHDPAAEADRRSPLGVADGAAARQPAANTDETAPG
jgi:hypothetical protein